MLKKTVTYEDFDGNLVTEDFHFHITKLEAIEYEAQFGEAGLEGKMRELTQTEDGLQAYQLFKDIVLGAYGERVGTRFLKKDPISGAPLSRNFEASPALGEIILEMLQNPASAADFIRAALPSKMVEEAEAEGTIERLPKGTRIIDDVPLPPEDAKSDDVGEIDYDALLAEMPDEEEVKQQPITQQQHDFMKNKLNDRQFQQFMLTRYVAE